MVTNLLTRIFGTKSERDLKKSGPAIDEINGLYLEYHLLSDRDLRYKTEEFKHRLADGCDPDDLLPGACAVLKEMDRRLVGKSWDVCDIETRWNMVPFDVQLLGAIVLHQGKIAEMATGEGKTLVATMPLFLNALSGRGAHLVTVNDYLARRDSQWMGKIYEMMGLTVGCIQNDMEPAERKKAYCADITYGTNNEFGFDYLRDNMSTRIEDRVQRGHHYAIVDEVDSILIDEARTPLIISGPVSVSRHKFDVYKPIVQRLAKEQMGLVNNMLAEVEDLVGTDDEYTAGIKLLAARRGAPKNKKLFKFMQDGNLRRLVDRVERDFMRDKRLHEIDEDLYFAIDEKANSVDLSENGRRFLEKNSGGKTLERSRRGPSGPAPEIRVTGGEGSLDFTLKTKKVLTDESTLDYLVEKAYPQVVVSEHGGDSFFMLPDSALAFQRIDAEAGDLLKKALVEEARPEGGEKIEQETVEDHLEKWLEINAGLVSVFQVKLRRKFEEDYGESSERLHNISQLLKAYSLFEKDVDYVVKADKVMIVDEFTGRLMPGRRFSDGLHQALEAKEGVTVERETQTLATVTIQNFFRLYEKLAGMTETEAGEFLEIYKLDVTVIPTNEPVRRMDYEDVIYLTKREKYNAIIDEIARMHEMGRPVLVGTVTVEVSEVLSRLLKRRGIDHSVLNAKYHEQEARIVSRAGEPAAVTIATNMAGRGTDIKLGDGVVSCDMCCYKCVDGNCSECSKGENTADKCVEDMPCGLHIMGTERHESRRIDRQLRGRAGRQGDPGSSRFYLSLEDDLMRLFGSDRLSGIISRLGIQEGEAIQHSLITKQIGRAQKRVEANNFAIRKHLLEYDDVMNKQREVVYAKRLMALESEDISSEIREMIEGVVERKAEAHVSQGSHPEEWSAETLKREMEALFLWPFDLGDTSDPRMSPEDLTLRLRRTSLEAYAAKQKEVGYEGVKNIERGLLLYVIDKHWRDHLYDLDGVRAGIGLRAYGQKDPLIEYKSEAFELFLKMLNSIDEEVVTLLFQGRWVKSEPESRASRPVMRAFKPDAVGPQPPPVTDPAAGPRPDGGASRLARGRRGEPRAPQVTSVKVGRNDPCPCGSGKKYKKCCGK